jgi:prevent-host-death family protein
MKIINITKAKTNLSALLKTLEREKEDIIIQRGNTPIARIIPYRKSYSCNRLGILKGQIKIAEDFDLWPHDIATSLGTIN